MNGEYSHAYDYDELNPQPLTREQLSGVRTARIFSFFIDYAIIALLTIPFAIIVGILGVLTLGLGWALYAILPAVVAIVYLAMTMGGPNQATIGMGGMGIKIRKLEGGRVDPFLAILHGVLFWVFASFPLLLLISLVSSKKRLLHDILLGTYVVRVDR
jgi:uncharacterized RDD family membrane protein YckC